MSQATLLERPYENSNLFSNHYLDERIKDRDEWDCDEEAQHAMQDLASLYELEGDLVSGYGEDALIDNWIDEVLEVLGFGTHEEVTLPDGGGYVDELLFETPDDRREAARLSLDTSGTTVAFERAVAILEAKQWDAKFNVRFSEQRPYRNASHQIKHYLENTPEQIQWGILTNGRKWRLYGTKDYETQTYYEVDLPELIERGDLEAFKYFFVLFRPGAFRATAGTTFLDEVWSESETASQELGEDLQDNVFTALRVLGRGFIETNDLNIDPDDQEALDELKEQSLVLLYRLMFVLYAESRGLIHPESPSAEDEYEENFSLDTLRLDIHEAIGEVDEGFDGEFSEYSTTIWSRLEDLFRLIDEGEESLGIPPYNGGLFDQQKHQFLSENKVSNRYLAEVIYRLSTTQNGERKYVLADYADLDTRHLGSVYEGLLEHQFEIAPEKYAAIPDDGGQVWEPFSEIGDGDAIEIVPGGGLYVVNDKGERKATGAYYTPDYVVTYIVEETVAPLVDEIRKDLIDQGFDPGTQEYLGPFLRRITQLKILDPAMGSGHFLTRATGYLSERVMTEVRDVEEEMPAAFDEQHIKREIAKECIYGVDINGMAVELAKLSMWLETLAADRPLAFLDHHLKEGNSLVGSDVTEVLSNGDGGEDDPGQITLTQALARIREETLDHVMDRMQELLEIDNETLTDVRSMEEIYNEIRADPLYQRLFELTNVHTAEQFGLSVPSDAYDQMARAIESESEWENIRKEDWFTSAQDQAKGETFFHWELEYPGVFFDQTGEQLENGGFDVVIGNPPYLNMDNTASDTANYLKGLYPEIQKGQADLLYFFVVRGIELLRTEGTLGYIIARYFMGAHFGEGFRKYLQERTSINTIIDFKNHTVFRNVGTKTCVSVFSKKPGDPDNNLKYLHLPERRTSRLDVPSAMIAPKDSDIFEHIEFPQKDLSEDRWVFPSQEERKLMEKIDSNSWDLGSISRVGMGMQTGANEVFEVDQKDIKENDIESEVLRKVVSNEEIRRYVIQYNERYWIYLSPYEDVSDQFPNAYNYLKSFKEDLEDRIAIERGDCEWYEFSYPRHTELYDGKKIITPFISPHNRFALDTEGDIYSSTDSQVIFPLNNTPVGLPYILAILNSNLSNWRYQYLGKMKDYRYEYSKDAISQLPIMKPPKSAEFDIPSVEHWEPISEILYKKGIDPSEIKSSNIEEKIEILVYSIMELIEDRNSINLSIMDYLGSYTEGPNLSVIGDYQPPAGVAETKLSLTTQHYDKLRIGRVKCDRESSDTVLVQATARFKPDDGESQETDRWGYTETDPIPALRLTNLTETEADLIEHFVPYAVTQAGGFANFRQNATKTNSLIDRLESLILPKITEVEDGLKRYKGEQERAEGLKEKIECIDELINKVVYELYGLTDQEIEIVDDAVTDE